MAGEKTSIRARVRDAYKNYTLKNLYPSRYRAACKAPVVPGRVVFLEIREKALSDNFKMIRAALEKWNQRRAESGKQASNRPEWTMETVCIREGMENRGSVVRNCLGAIKQLAQAQFIFVNEVSYFLSCLPLRSETTVIQTWHACGAFKKFGYSAAGTGFGTTKEDLETYPVHRNFSYVTVSAPEVVWAYAEAFHMEDRIQRILPIGVSRTDMFFSRKYREKAYGKTSWILRRMAPELFLGSQTAHANSADAYQEYDSSAGAESAYRRDGSSGGAESVNQGHSSSVGAERVYQGNGGSAGVRDHELSSREIYAKIGDVYSDRAEDRGKAAELSAVPGKKIILYAPTYRGTVGKAAAPEQLDIPMMKRMLGKDCVLLINHHPFIKAKNRPKIPENCRNFAFDMTDRLSIEELLTVADICITDYSSLIFEYSLFERPMVFFAYDMKHYLDERGFYYPVTEMMPGPVCSTTREVVNVLSREDAEFDLARVREFKYRFMSGCDGHATARVLKLMEQCLQKGRKADL